MAERQFIPCAYCAATFKQKRDSEKYCCRSCYDASRAMTPKACLHCSKPFLKKTNHQAAIFCSENCQIASRRVNPHMCVTCGAMFSPVKYKKSEGRYVGATGRHNCSKDCIDAWKAKTKSEYMRSNREKFSGPNSWNWVGACLRKNRSYRGSDWSVIAERIRSRDGMACRHCAMTSGAHMERWRQALEVHHVVPFYEFTDHKKANRASNLITLCKSCHMTADRAIKNRQILIFFADEPHKKSTKPRPVGEASKTAKLNDLAVGEIKLLLVSGCKQADIAMQFGVSNETVSAINTGRVWSHIKCPENGAKLS